MNRLLRLSAGAAFLASLCAVASAQGWPEVFEPTQLLTLNFEMDPGDWATIQADETFDIEVPAMFWADGEDPILVSVRRKSADPLNAGGGYSKVSLKVDINEFVSGQRWRDLKKLSLENGDDQDVVSEGYAWQMHRFASGALGYGYEAGLAAWVRVIINGTDTGVYVNVEQRDDQFLENRGLWIEDETWLYKLGDINTLELEEGDGDSPQVLDLCYPPFRSGVGACATPDAVTLAAELGDSVDMQAMLTLGVVNTFASNPDALFNHGKNIFFADYLNGLRLYFPWDLDSSLSGGVTEVYPEGSPYADILLAVPEFRAEYTTVARDLLCGPMSEAQLLAFLDAVEPVLGTALAADPNNQIDGSVADHFEGLRAWTSNRVATFDAGLDGEPGDCELGTRYCSPAVANSTGAPGRLAVHGSTTVADDTLVLEARDLPPQPNIGYFLMGTGTNTFVPPGSAGPICIAPGLRRFLPPVENTTELDGGFVRAVGTAGPVSGDITPGSTWNFQAWHRDALAGTSNLTDAVAVTFR